MAVERVFYVDVNLGTVEGPIALVEIPLNATLRRQLNESLFELDFESCQRVLGANMTDQHTIASAWSQVLMSPMNFSGFLVDNRSLKLRPRIP